MNIEILSSVFAQLFTLEVIVALLIGVVGGMVVGALPGLSATMAVALLLPLTFSMGTIAGLVMLTGLYTSAMYGGSISAILLHTPGTPSSAATALDGYEMTKQGRGLEAIGISTISSMIGGVFSALVLLFLAPPLSLVSLKFSEPEYFLIAIFGLTIISSLASDSVVKGLLSGVFGLLIGLIGTDILTGFPRFTFGISELESGISLVPAMIGLFSISQVLSQMEAIRDAKRNQINKVDGKVLPSWTSLKKIGPTITLSSVIGLFVGMLPGAGGDIGSWVGYNEAKKLSKNPEKFGKGCIEGVAAPEAANNAVTGGALIPLLVLGIPGSAVTAVLLGGLMIQGLVPGRDLFTVHATTTYSVIVGLIFANLLMGIIGLLAAKHIVKVTNISFSILIPVIIVFSLVGSYAINNSMFDVYVMVFFGVVGYLMKKTGFHPAPVVLAIILGPLAEGGLRRAMVMAKGDFLLYLFQRPISVVLIIMILLSILSPIILNYRKKKKEEEVAL
ncbi:tripartite tricarboxylate transporter permease [Bacillus dakarensis]|uniref:tripartite tricarboxylate transporter permease n=1 Tax=Robertmurraya dakarensis TaxID=1926278 RepID=UPI000981CD05|nr:tripartite tricarboxylate transporter permease [Bacillus dakarensis]